MYIPPNLGGRNSTWWSFRDFRGNWHLILAESEQFEYTAKVIPVIVQPKEIFARKHT